MLLSRILQRHLHTATATTSLIPHARLETMRDGIMTIVLDRERARNALSCQMVNEIRDALATVSSSSSAAARILLITSSSPTVFCAGADLRERRTMSQAQVDSFLTSLNELVNELERVPLPTLAVVSGPALGGGTELALGCDLRVGGPAASFALPETKLGIIPGAGGTQRLTRLIGPSRAKELVFTGRRVGAQEAATIGLLNVLAAQGDPLDAAVAMASQILSSAPLALRAAKMAINGAADGTHTLAEGLALERQAYGTLLETEDRQEGLRAFAEKRPPVFTGR